MRPGTALGLVLAILLIAPSSAAAVDRIWDGGGDGVNWNSPNNWAPDGIPTTADDVFLSTNSAQDATLTGTAATVRSVSSSAADLTIDGTTLTLTASTTSAAPKITVINSGRLDVTGSFTTNGLTLGNATPSMGFLDVHGTVLSSGIGEGAAGNGSIKVFANGTLQSEGGTITSRFENDGTVNGSALDLRPQTASPSSEGTWSLGTFIAIPPSGSTLAFAAGEVTTTNVLSLQGAGQTTVASGVDFHPNRVQLVGTLDVAGAHDIGELDLSGGRRQGSGTLNATACAATCALGQGTFAGGTTTLAGPVTISPGTGVNALIVNGGATVRATGTTTWSSGDLWLGDTGTGFFENGGTMTVSGSAVLPGGGGVLRNLGAGTMTLSALTGEGSLSSAGTLNVNATVGSVSGVGSLAVTGGTTDVASGVTVRKAVAVSGTGTLSPAGTMTVTGGYTQTGGTLRIDIDSASTFDKLQVGGAASLGGRLDLDSTGFTPATTDTFKIIQSASRSGQFAEVTNAVVGGLQYRPRYDADGVTLTVGAADPPAQNPGPGTGTTTGESPPPDINSNGYVPAQAAFTPSDSELGRGDHLRLDASRSGSSATTYAWNLDGDPAPEAICDAEQPLLDTRLYRSTTVALTVTDSRGARSTSSAAIRIATTARAAQRQRTSSSVATLERFGSKLEKGMATSDVAALCKRGATQGGTDITAVGGPGPGCVDKAELRAALASAIGCLRDADDWNDIPAAERNRVLALLGRDPDAPKSLSKVITGGARAAQIGGSLDKARDQTRSVISDGIWIAEGTVRINGLDYVPVGGAHVIIVKPGLYRSSRTPHVVSSNVEVTLPTPDVIRPPLLRSRAPMTLELDKAGVQIGSVPVNAGVPFLPGMALVGNVRTSLLDQASVISTTLQLPDFLSLADSGATTVGMKVTTTNRGGVQLAGFRVENIDAELAGIGIHLDYLEYDATQKFFGGKGAVALGPAAGRFEAEVQIRGGDLTYLHFGYDLPAPGIKVAPAVFLISVNADLENSAERLAFGGGARFAGGPGFGNGCALVSATGQFGLQLDPGPVTLTVDGTGEMGCIDLLEAHGVLAADGYASLAAKIDKSLGPFSVRVGWKIEFDLSGHFTGQADAYGCVDDYGCLGGTALVSDKGLAFCADFGWVTAGAGLDWPIPPNVVTIIANLDIMVPGCDVSGWRTVHHARAAQAAPAPITVAASGDREGIVIGVIGESSAPRVALHGPGGRTITLPEQGRLQTADVTAFRVPDRRTTFIAIKGAQAGRWTVESLDGQRITETRRADVMLKPRISASVERQGDRVEVHYSASSQPGQVVRFYEQTPRGIQEIGAVKSPAATTASAAATRRRGTLRFMPSDVAGTKRSIFAIVEQDGVPREKRTLATFTAGPPRLGSPRRVRIRRAGKGIAVSFRPGRNALQHVVVVRLSDGRAIQRTLGRRARSVRVAGVARRTRVRAAVISVRGQGTRRSRATVARKRV